MVDKKKIVLVIVFILGFSILLYPIISNIAHSTSQTHAIYKYNKELRKLNKEQRKKEIEEAKKYNESLINTEITEINVKDPYEGDGTASEKQEKGSPTYRSVIDVKNIIGNIEIPRIGVEIPIYKGTSELVLQKGVGHIEGSSLPVGGLGTHTALTAHRGLPSTRLFRNLDKLKLGDEFYIHNGEGTIAYKVDNIEIVLPYETERIAIDKDKDYASLITCEPYMINTHRLLVRGIRTDYVEKDKDIESKSKTNLFYKYRDFIILGIIFLLGLILFMRRRSSVKNRNNL